MHAVLEGELAENNMGEGGDKQQIVRNRALLQYLVSLANSNSNEDKFDFDFVESLLKNGADVNSTDKTGQTVFHEVARSWNVDVAKFLINNGKNSSYSGHISGFFHATRIRANYLFSSVIQFYFQSTCMGQICEVRSYLTMRQRGRVVSEQIVDEVETRVRTGKH